MESQVFSKYLNETQAREPVMRTLFCGKIVARGFKGDIPVLTATQDFDHTVRLKPFENRHCFSIAVIFH